MVIMRRGFRREIDALDEIFRFLEDFVAEAAIDERAAFTINLVAEELFTNMVRHNTGGGDVVDLSIERVGDVVRLGLIDFDVEPFDPADVPAPLTAAAIGERRPGGLGLHLVQTMVDDVKFDYEPETRRLRVSVTKNLETESDLPVPVPLSAIRAVRIWILARTREPVRGHYDNRTYTVGDRTISSADGYPRRLTRTTVYCRNMQL